MRVWCMCLTKLVGSLVFLYIFNKGYFAVISKLIIFVILLKKQLYIYTCMYKYDKLKLLYLP